MLHPFRPPVPPSASSRSTESPMDFVYDRPPSDPGALADQPKSTIRPMNVIGEDGRLKEIVDSNRPKNASDQAIKSYSWLALPSSSSEPPRKRLHCETESMDWESCPPARSDPHSKPTVPLAGVDSTRPQTPAGGTFIFQIPNHLPPPPIFTAPGSSTSSTSSSSSCPQPHLSPKKIGPASFGLQPRHRSVHPEDQDGDSSLDVEPTVLQSSSSKMYSNNGVKHENRRRLKAQNLIRSKLSRLSFTSDEDEDDSDIEVVSNKKGLVTKSKDLNKRVDRTPSTPATTNNYLTINGWKAPEGRQRQNQSKLSTDTPYVLLVYLQLLFNSSLVFVALYLVINLILIIRTDINHKVLDHITRLRQEIESCTQEYNTNRCFPVEQRTKFIEKHCIEWEVCMSRDPKSISRSRIGAETFAEVMNGFVDVISWKTMLFIFLSIGAGIYATNLAMNNYKSKWEPRHSSKSHSSSPWTPRFLSRQDWSSLREVENHKIDPMIIFGQGIKADHPSTGKDQQ